jgi:hypothetical protein
MDLAIPQALVDAVYDFIWTEYSTTGQRPADINKVYRLVNEITVGKVNTARLTSMLLNQMIRAGEIEIQVEWTSRNNSTNGVVPLPR